MSECRSVVEVLVEARGLIADESRWTTGMASNGPYCAMGALYAARGEAVAAPIIHMPAYKVLKAALGGGEVGRFNDSHSHAEVLALFDRAIGAERAKERREIPSVVPRVRGCQGCEATAGARA